MERPLRLITTSPLDELTRTLEALLVVASQPLSVEELADAAEDDADSRLHAARGSQHDVVSAWAPPQLDHARRHVRLERDDAPAGEDGEHRTRPV